MIIKLGQILIILITFAISACLPTFEKNEHETSSLSRDEILAKGIPVDCYSYANYHRLVATSYLGRKTKKQLLQQVLSSNDFSESSKDLNLQIINDVYKNKPTSLVDDAAQAYIRCLKSENTTITYPTGMYEPSVYDTDEYLKAVTACFNLVILADASLTLKSKGTSSEEAKKTLNDAVFGKQDNPFTFIGLASYVDFIVRKTYQEGIIDVAYKEILFNRCLRNRNATEAKGVVTEVYSGDHFRVRLDNNNELDIYTMGMKAPTRSNPLFANAKRALEDYILNKNVDLSYFQHRNGYLLSSVKLEFQDIVLEMIQSGFGQYIDDEFDPSMAIDMSSLEIANVMSGAKGRIRDEIEASPELWEGIRYSMSVNDVLENCPTCLPVDAYDSVGVDSAVERLVLENVRIFDFKTRGRFFFSSNGLSQIIFSFSSKNNGGTSLEDIHTQLEAALVKEYGRDDFNSFVESARLLTDLDLWHDGSRDISLAYVKTADGAVVLNLIFQKFEPRRLISLKTKYGI